MFTIRKPVLLVWTLHAQAKMGFYKLSQARVRRVINVPKRTEEGVAPKTVAMMQPASLKRSVNGKEVWTQEIWTMVQDMGKQRKVISAWRYPGVTKPRDEISMKTMRKEYNEFINKQ
jgi:hypothetical protein